MRTRFQIPLPAALLLLLPALLSGVPRAAWAAAPPAKPGNAQAVAVTTPVATQLTRRLVATGSIQAWQEVIIAPEVGGYQVATMRVEIGDRVKKGQELATLSAGILESQVTIARASVKQAEASLTNARAALGRGESMSASGNFARADLDTLRSNAIAAEAAVATAQANLDAADLRLRYTHVRAPDDGVITARSAVVGQVVQAGTEMMRLLRQERVEWRAEVPEADLRTVRAGQKVSIETSEGTALMGKVRSVAPTVQSGNRTGIVYVDIPARSGARPGMFARGEIDTGQAQALMLPLSAVLVQDGYSYVFLVRDDATVQRRRIETGAVQGQQIEVTSGLVGSERLVTSGVAFLSDGQRVSVKTGT
jgi:RND family efflux transporter MFP subunit